LLPAFIEKAPVFGIEEKLRSHENTMMLRKKLGSASAALKSDSFLDGLRETLRWWGGDGQGAKLVDRDKFRREL
jgi:hypothetical protein